MTVISQVIENTADHDPQKIQKTKMKVNYDSFFNYWDCSYFNTFQQY